jgi:hypothetical protein
MKGIKIEKALWTYTEVGLLGMGVGDLDPRPAIPPFCRWVLILK